MVTLLEHVKPEDLEKGDVLLAVDSATPAYGLRLMELRSKPVLNADGAYAQVMVMGRDVAERLSLGVMNTFTVARRNEEA